MNNSSAPLPSLRQIWPPGVPWIPACAGMTKGDAVSLPPRRRGTGSRARTSSPRRRGSRKTPGDHPRVGARPSFERERRSHVPTKAARPKGDGRARRAQPPAFAGAGPRQSTALPSENGPTLMSALGAVRGSSLRQDASGNNLSKQQARPFRWPEFTSPLHSGAASAEAGIPLSETRRDLRCLSPALIQT